MNYYHIWCNLIDSKKDVQFARSVDAYLGALKAEEQIAGWRVTRRKLGFGPDELGEFHLVLEFRDLTQLEAAFSRVAARSGELERLHGEVYGAVTDFRSALYRDFPDPERARNT